MICYKTCALVLLVVVSTTQCRQLVPYPVEDESRLEKLNENFLNEVVKLALGSLEAILDMTNVSTKLSGYQLKIEKEEAAYEKLVKSAEEIYTEILECKEQIAGKVAECSNCLLGTCEQLSKSCNSESVYSAFDETIPLMKHLSKTKFKTLSFNINHEELFQGKQMVENLQLELTKISGFFIRLLSLFTNNIEQKKQMQEYLSQRLNVSSSELLKLFRSVKILSLVRAGDIRHPSHKTVQGVIEGVTKLMNTVGGVNSSIVTAEDVQSMMDFPEPKKETTLWEEILDSLDGFWGSVKGGAAKAWDTTKDVSKTAYCSVKSVFFDSKCDDSKRRRRSVGILPKPGRPDCSEKLVMELVSECEKDYLQQCPACSKMLEQDVCGAKFSGKLSAYKNLAFDVITQESNLKNAIKQVDSNRDALVNQTKQSLKDNLWVVSMNKLLEAKTNPFVVKSVYYDPQSFSLRQQKVKYEGVQIYIVVEGSRDASNIIFSLPPLDVHNVTEIAQKGADIFVNTYKQWPSVQSTVALLLENAEQFTF